MSWHGHVHQESLVMMLIDLLIWLHQQLEPSIFMLLTKMMERMSKLLGICFKNSDLPSFTTLLWVSRFLLIHDLSHASLRKQLTFGAPTTGFPIKWRLRNKHRNSILMMCHYLDLDSASDWSCHIGNLVKKPVVASLNFACFLRLISCFYELKTDFSSFCLKVKLQNIFGASLGFTFRVDSNSVERKHLSAALIFDQQ